MSAYYNEIDPYAAQWLRNLIAGGHIAPGDVDERSIADVQPEDVKGYTQCHFFAGIGGWSYALRLSLWPDDRPVWTGSCPCQPFSAAGKGKASGDERHLWPIWFELIRACRPSTIFGEQVEAAIGWGWLDLVYSDLEPEGYTVGAAILPACSVGAPHIRQRLWFVADTERGTTERWRYDVADTQRGMQGEVRQQRLRADLGNGGSDGMGNADAAGLEGRGIDVGEYSGQCSPWSPSSLIWLPCTDGKQRPTKPGLFPLAHGVSCRVGKLRAYGNAITPQVAAEFIKAAT